MNEDLTRFLLDRITALENQNTELTNLAIIRAERFVTIQENLAILRQFASSGDNTWLQNKLQMLGSQINKIIIEL